MIQPTAVESDVWTEAQTKTRCREGRVTNMFLPRSKPPRDLFWAFASLHKLAKKEIIKRKNAAESAASIQSCHTCIFPWRATRRSRCLSRAATHWGRTPPVLLRSMLSGTQKGLLNEGTMSIFLAKTRASQHITKTEGWLEKKTTLCNLK